MLPQWKILGTKSLYLRIWKILCMMDIKPPLWTKDFLMLKLLMSSQTKKMTGLFLIRALSS